MFSTTSSPHTLPPPTVENLLNLAHTKTESSLRLVEVSDHTKKRIQAGRFKKFKIDTNKTLWTYYVYSADPKLELLYWFEHLTFYLTNKIVKSIKRNQTSIQGFTLSSIDTHLPKLREQVAQHLINPHTGYTDKIKKLESLTEKEVESFIPSFVVPRKKITTPASFSWVEQLAAFIKSFREALSLPKITAFQKLQKHFQDAVSKDPFEYLTMCVNAFKESAFCQSDLKSSESYIIRTATTPSLSITIYVTAVPIPKDIIWTCRVGELDPSTKFPKIFQFEELLKLNKELGTKGITLSIENDYINASMSLPLGMTTTENFSQQTQLFTQAIVNLLNEEAPKIGFKSAYPKEQQ